MANAQAKLYNFYFRYKWSDVDFLTWQTGVVDTVHGAMEGGFGAGVVKGGAVTPGSGMHVEIATFIAVGPTGYMHISNSPIEVTLTTADGTNPRRDLIVCRPNYVGASSITRPTIPFDSVFLQELQETQVVVITGTAAASPAYPSAASDDVILAAVRVAPGATSFVQSDIIMHIRDIPGKYSNFQQQQSRWDDRLRTFVSTNQILGIKPAQLFGENGQARAFTYVSSSVASRFPQDGTGKIANADTLVNFQTGTVTGGDAITPDITPTIPTAGNCIVAAVALNTNDTLNVQFGVIGTRAQCTAAIYNQTVDGSAGSIVSPTNSMPIAFILLSSKDGSNITELEIFDARTPFVFIGSTQLRRYPNVLVAGDGTGDYTTLNAAITALPSGGVIVLAANTTVTTNCTIPDNTKIVGRPNATLTVNTGVVISGGNRITLEELVVDHTGATSGNCFNITGNYFAAYNCTFKESASGTGVSVSVTGNFPSIEDCSFYGVLLPSTGTGVLIGNNVIDWYLNNNTYLN